jgi:hypothetical protein
MPGSITYSRLTELFRFGVSGYLERRTVSLAILSAKEQFRPSPFQLCFPSCRRMCWNPLSTGFSLGGRVGSVSGGEWSRGLLYGAL